MNSRLSSDQWTRYWEKGTYTTFLGRFQNNYDGELRQHWDARFARLDNDSRIVDLATGNGALAFLAASYGHSNRKNFFITAIDYAEIDPANLVRAKQPQALLDTIEFVPNTPMEETGLEARSFDCAISQFGFEYGDEARVIPELARIVKPGGELIAMMHFEGSILYKQAETGFNQVSVCETSELHPALKQLLTKLETLTKANIDPATNREAEDLRHTVNEITGSLHDAMDEFEDPTQIGFFLENSMAVFRPEMKSRTTAEKSKMLDEIQEETIAYKQRMADLMSAAKSENDISNLETMLHQNGFDVEQSGPFTLEGHAFCYRLEARRQTT